MGNILEEIGGARIKNVRVWLHMNFEIGSNKQLLIDAKLKEVREFKDRLGYPVDARIVEAVAMLQLLGLNTAGSCEGHVDEPGRMAPWVDVEAPNEPEYRYKGEQHITDTILSEFGIDKNTLLDGETDAAMQAWEKLNRALSHEEETEEYKQWTAENKRLAQKMKMIIAEYEQQEDIAKKGPITIDESGNGSVRIHTGGEDFKRNSRDLAESEKEEMRVRLQRSQEVMNVFIQYLRERFLHA